MKIIQMMAIWMIVLMITLPAIAALEISEITIEERKYNRAVISWKTDKDADAEVKYYDEEEPVVQSYRNSTISKEHKAILASLAPDSWYKYELYSATPAGEAAAVEGGNYRLKTLPEPDTTPAQITDMKLALPTDNSARITFKTNEGARATLYYGTTEAMAEKIERRDYNTEHTFLLSVEKGTRYYYKLQACDSDNNCANSTRMQFAGGMDITPPTLKTNIPRYYNSNKLDITGTTEPMSRLDLRVNGILSRTGEIGAEGSFSFKGVALITGSNTILIAAADPAGNAYNESYNVTVDKTGPRLIVNALPESAPRRQISVNGTVSKLTTITITVSSREDITPPPQATGLKVVDTGTNSIKISWNEIAEDIEEYSIYRDGKRITTTADNSFIDAALDSGKSYEYRISAVDESCNEGRRSDAVVAATVAGGQIIGSAVEEVNLSCSAYKFEKSFTVMGIFNEQIQLSDGINLVKATATDAAGNRAEYSATVMHDETKPEITDTNLKRASPTYIRDVTLRGKVSEPAKIIVTVNGDKQYVENTQGDDNYFEVDIVIDSILNKKKEHFTDKEKEERTLADRKGLTISTTDAYVNDIEIKAIDRAGLEDVETGAIEFTKCGSGSWWKIDVSEARPSIMNPRMLLEGMGQFGMAVNISWQGGFGNGTIRSAPKIRFVPMSLEKFSEYNLDYFQPPVATWSNDRTQGYITVTMNPMDLSQGQEMTTYEKEQLISEFNLDNCTIGGIGCVKLPMQIEVDFELSYPEGYFTKQFDRTVENEFVERLTQKQCWDVEIFIDHRIDPGLVPSYFLQAMVDMLTNIIDFIDQILAPLETIQEIVFYSCAATIGLQFVVNIQQEWNCGWGKTIRDLFGGGFKVEIAQTGLCEDVYQSDDKKQSACMACQNAIKRSRDIETLRNWICDRMFCPSAPTFQKHVKDSKKPEGKLTIMFSEVGSSSSSFRGTAAEGITVDTRSDCAPQVKPVWGTGNDKSYDIKDLWKRFGKDRPPLGINIPLFSSLGKAEEGKTDCSELHSANPDCCVAEYRRRWDSACLIMDEFKESACLAAEEANKLNELSSVGLRCNRLWNAVAGFCEPEGKPVADLVNTGLEYDAKKNYQGYYEVSGMDGLYEVVSEQGDTYALVKQGDSTGAITHVKKEGTTLTPKEKPRSDPKATGKAFASLIGMAAPPGVQVITPADAKRFEEERKGGLLGVTSGGGFACLKGHRIRDGDDKGIYYRILPPANGDEQWYVHRGVIITKANVAISDEFMVTKVGSGIVPDGRSHDPGGDTPINAQLVFRPLSENLAQYFDETERQKAAKDEYAEGSKGSIMPPEEEFVEKSAHPYFRNDLYGCLGTQDRTGFARTRTSSSTKDMIDNIYNEIRQKIGMTDKAYIVDPTSGLLRTVQCACLPGVISYLKLYKNMADAIRNCFQTILLTGDGSAGVCQAVISVYVCDLIFDLIKCFTQKYSLGMSRDVGMGIGNIFGAITSAGSKTFSSVQNRYGSTNLFKALFVDRKLIHAICLFAFTGIWNLDISELLDQEAGVPIKSQGFMYPCERRFISFDPSTSPSGLTTWNYHIGAGLVSGADISYRIELVCSAEPSCSIEDGYNKGICDCQKSGKEEAVVIKTGRLGKGEVLDEEGEIFETMGPAQKRYDKVRMRWDFINNQGESDSDSTECKIREKGGKPPINCEFDGTAFRCGVDFGSETDIKFNSEPAPIYFSDYKGFRLKDEMKFAYDIEMKMADSTKIEYSDNKNTKYLGVRIFNNHNKKVYDSRDAVSGGKFDSLYADGRITGTFAANKLVSSMFAAGETGLGLAPHTNVDVDTTETKRYSTEGSGVSNNYYFIIKKEVAAYKYYILRQKAGQDINNIIQQNAGSIISGDSMKELATGFTQTTQGASVTGKLQFNDGLTTIRIEKLVFTLPQNNNPGVILITYTNPVDSGFACQAEDVEFIAEFTIYDAALNHGIYEASNTVSRDNQGNPQTRRVRFKVLCSATGFTQTEETLRCKEKTSMERCFCGPDKGQNSFEEYLANPAKKPNCGTEIDKTNGNPNGDINGGYCIDKTKCSNLPRCDTTGQTAATGEGCVCNVEEWKSNSNGICNANKFCYSNDGEAGKETCNANAKSTPPKVAAIGPTAENGITIDQIPSSLSGLTLTASIGTPSATATLGCADGTVPSDLGTCENVPSSAITGGTITAGSGGQVCASGMCAGKEHGDVCYALSTYNAGEWTYCTCNGCTCARPGGGSCP